MKTQKEKAPKTPKAPKPEKIHAKEDPEIPAPKKAAGIEKINAKLAECLALVPGLKMKFSNDDQRRAYVEQFDKENPETWTRRS